MPYDFDFDFNRWVGYRFCVYIKTQQELNGLCHKASETKLLGIDLEFIPENTYYPKLALIQIAVGETFALVDPLGPLDLTPIDKIVVNPLVRKVVHAGSQDMGIFFNRTETPPQNVFDTQIAAGFAGFGHQISYGQMVKVLLGISLEKSQSYTNWLQRPLTAKQESYALDDVQYILPAYHQLTQTLTDLNRMDWVLDETGFYENQDFYKPDPALAYKRVKRSNSLKGKDQTVLIAVALWRELTAQQMNKPRRKVLMDEVLIELARRKPKTENQLYDIRGLYARDIKRNGAEIIRAIREGESKLMLEEKTVPFKKHLAPSQELVVDYILFCLKAICLSAKISTNHVASRAQIESIVNDHLHGKLDTSKHGLFSGWRKKAAGDQLLDCLNGHVHIGLDPAFQIVLLAQSQSNPC